MLYGINGLYDVLLRGLLLFHIPCTSAYTHFILYIYVYLYMERASKFFFYNVLICVLHVAVVRLSFIYLLLCSFWQPYEDFPDSLHTRTCIDVYLVRFPLKECPSRRIARKHFSHLKIRNVCNSNSTIRCHPMALSVQSRSSTFYLVVELVLQFLMYIISLKSYCSSDTMKQLIFWLNRCDLISFDSWIYEEPRLVRFNWIKKEKLYTSKIKIKK